MATAQGQYLKEMKKKFGYYATWNPGVPLELGDIGVVVNDEFQKISNLRNRGIEFNVRPDLTKTYLEYTSEGSSTVTTKASGAASPSGSTLATVDAGFIVEFSKSNATLFRANGTTTPSIEDTISLGEKILKEYADGKWNSKWVIITELVVADSATIIISNNSSAKIEAKATTNISAPQIDIADIQLGFATTSYSGLESKIIAQAGLTPLLRVMGIRSKHGIIPWRKEFAFKRRAPMDLVTPESSKGEHKEMLYFDYISDSTIA